MTKMKFNMTTQRVAVHKLLVSMTVLVKALNKVLKKTVAIPTAMVTLKNDFKLNFSSNDINIPAIKITATKNSLFTAIFSLKKIIPISTAKILLKLYKGINTETSRLLFEKI